MQQTGSLHMDTRDPLTGAYSRLHMQERLNEEIDRALRYNSIFSVLMMDLDYFKSINDAFGHQRGDEVLKEFVRRINSVSRVSDLLFRYGGDEFVMVLPGTALKEATVFARRLYQQIHDLPFAGEPPLTMTISIGVAEYGVDGKSPEQIVDTADKRCYQAKRRGRGQVVSEDLETTDTVQVEELERLIERDQALDVLQQFLDQAAGRRLSILEVGGVPGSGRTRFLEEVRRSARLRGYQVLSVRGGPGLSLRVDGALENACRESGLGIFRLNDDIFPEELDAYLNEKKGLGWVITLDDPNQIDSHSLELIHRLALSQSSGCLVIAVIASPRLEQMGFFSDLGTSQKVVLNPLSENGIRVWIRHSLHWEAPQHLIQWMMRETQGHPGKIQRCITRLLLEDVIERVNDQWYCRLDDRMKYRQDDPDENIPYRLPEEQTEFVGREIELESLTQNIRQKRLVVIHGAGGVGKSRLAAQAAMEELKHFPGGVYWISMEGANSPETFISLLIETMGLSISGGKRTILEQLFELLAHRRILFVLDNFETARELTAVLLKIHNELENCHFLVVSRESLNLPEIVELSLDGLDLPKTGQIEPVKLSAAGRLFLLRAYQNQPEYSLGEDDLEQVVRICRLTAGVPLAIELAAAWVWTLSLKEIVSRLEMNEDTGISPDHLDPVFASFWMMLSRYEQRVLAQLTVFRGGFTEEAARNIADASLFFLDGLTTKAYLKRSTDGRFEMQELLRQYAIRQVPASVEEDARKKHAVYYGKWMKSILPEIRRGIQSGRKISADSLNLRTGWKWAIDHQAYSILPGYLEGLAYYYQLNGFFEEAVLVFQQAASLMTGLEDRDFFIKQRMMGEMAQNMVELGRFEDALQLSLQIWDQARQHGNLSILARIDLVLGQCYYRLSKYDDARKILLEGLELSRKVRSSHGAVDALCFLGQTAYFDGDFRTARMYFTRGLKTAQKLGDVRRIAVELTNLGAVENEEGDYEKARAYFEHNLKMRERLGDRRGVAAGLNNLGNVADAQGNYEEARGYYQRSLKIQEEIGDRRNSANGYNNLGIIEQYLGNMAIARRYLLQALNLFEDFGSRVGVAMVLSNLGDLYFSQQDYTASRDVQIRCLEICKELHELRGVTISCCNLSRLALQAGEVPQAKEYLTLAVQYACESELAPMILSALASTAECFVFEHQWDRALRLASFVTHHLAADEDLKQRMETIHSASGCPLLAEEIDMHWMAGKDMSQDDCLNLTAAT